MAQLGLNGVGEISPHIFWDPPDWIPKPKPVRVMEPVAPRASAS